MICLSGQASIADIVGIADGSEDVCVKDGTLDVVRQAHETARDLSGRVPTYGRTTGVGANKSARVAGEDDRHGLRLLRSHAVDAGERLPDRTVRAMLAVRLNQLCLPGSGIAPAVLEALVRMLRSDSLPVVRGHAGIGTGDLGPLAGTALTLMGERPATRPLEPMAPWTADNALPFISSSALTLGRACLTVDELDRLDRASAFIYALAFLGLNGNSGAISAGAAGAAAAPGVSEVAARIRGLLGGTVVLPARIQDAYGLRAYIVSEGAFLTAYRALGDQIVRVLNCAQENPLFDTAGSDVIHHAGFFQAALALAVDGCNLALAQTAPLTLSRIRMLNEPEFTDREAFLAAGPAGSSGLMMVEYVAASALAEMRAAAQPASLGTVVLSRGAEEDASFASQAVVQTERAVAAYRVLLACELVAAARLLRQQGQAGCTPGGGLYQCDGPLALAGDLLAALPDDDRDRDLRPDLEIGESLLDDLGRLVPAL